MVGKLLESMQVSVGAYDSRVKKIMGLVHVMQNVAENFVKVLVCVSYRVNVFRL